jgi:uncharacterized protein (DUF488 family)
LHPDAPLLFTAGHSNRAIGELLALLVEAGVRTVADVRRFPRSRRHPWFDAEPLRESLAEAGLGHVHFEALGGLRDEPLADLLPLVGALPEPWPAYAAHARTEAFQEAFQRLLRTARSRGPVAIVCAEREPEGCHRRLIADAATLAGWRVVHLVAPGQRREHEPHPLAALVGGRLAYPPRQASLFD